MVSCAYLFCDLGYYKLIKVYLFTKKSPLEIKVHIKIVRQKHKMGENMSLKHAPAYLIGKSKKKIFINFSASSQPTRSNGKLFYWEICQYFHPILL